MAAAPRIDMKLFCKLEESPGKQVEPNGWSTFAEAHRWIRIPPTIKNERKLVHNELQAFYIDTMNLFVHFGATSEWTVDF